MTTRKKQNFLQHKDKHRNNKEAYTDGLKNMRKKLGFAAVFADIIKRGALHDEAPIYTAEMTALRKIHNRQDKRWSIYPDLVSSLQAIEYIQY